VTATAAKAEALLMSPRYLLDTNTANYIIKGNIPRVRERLLKVPMSGLLISAVTEGELLYGAARKSDSVRLKTAVDEFLLRVDSLAWDSNAARRYADLRAALEIAGTPMGNLDMMIAAQALAAEAILVTNDRSFFRLKHLKIEDWTK
jgi:tRNA(fMet)-specific endonuclease VapC